MAFTAKTLLIFLEYIFEFLINTALQDSIASIGRTTQDSQIEPKVVVGRNNGVVGLTGFEIRK